MTVEELKKRLKNLEKKVIELENRINDIIDDDQGKMQKESLQKKINLDETCAFLREITDELEKEKVNFPAKSFRIWVYNMQNSQNPEEYCNGILSTKKLKLGDIMSMFEKNKDKLIKEIRGFGLSSYEKLMKKLKEKKSD